MTKMSGEELLIVPFDRFDEHYTTLSPGQYAQLDPRRGHGDVAWAAIGCPMCGKVMLLTKEKHVVDSLGTVEPEMLCAATGCEFRAIGHLDDWRPQARGRA